MATVLPFRRRGRPLIATIQVREAPLPQPSRVRVPARLLDEKNVDAAATWINRAYAVLEKAPDWQQLPVDGRVLRLRGLIDDEARKSGVDRMSDRGWRELVLAYAAENIGR